MRRFHRPFLHVSALLALAMLATTLPTSVAQAEVRRSARMAGADRYGTAVAVSRSSWPSGADVAFLTAAGEFADALAIGAPASDRGPVLLADRDRLPQATVDELRRLQPSTLVVVGGRNAVSDGVLRSAARYARTTVRVAGADRYATSVEVARTFGAETTRVYVANGGTYETAIVGSTAAGTANAPLLLVGASTLPPVVERYLAEVAPDEVIVVGDAEDVSETVLNRIRTHAGSVRRIAGRDHAETAALASRADHTLSRKVLVATRATFPDALTGGAYAAKLGAPLLFVEPDRVPLATACEVARLGATEISVLGGSRAVSDGVVRALRDGSAVPDAAACARRFIPMAGAPLHDGVFDPTGETLYVVNHEENQVEVVDVASGAQVRSIWVGSDPLDIDITKDGRYLYVTHYGSHDVLVVDVASGAWVGPRIRLPYRATGNGDVTRAYTLAIDATDRVLITNSQFRADDGGPLFAIHHATWLDAHRRWASRPADDDAYVTPTHVGSDFVPPDGATASRIVRSADRSVVGLIVSKYDTGVEPNYAECESLPTEEQVANDPDVRTKEDCRAEKEKQAEEKSDSGLLIWNARSQSFGLYAREWGETVSNVAFDPTGRWAVVHGAGETTFVVDVASVFSDELALRGTVTSSPGAEGVALGTDRDGCLVAWRLVDGESRAALEVLQIQQMDPAVRRCRDRYRPARGADGRPLVITLDDEMTPDEPRLNEVDLTRAQLILAPGARTLAAMTATGVQLVAPPVA